MQGGGLIFSGEDILHIDFSVSSLGSKGLYPISISSLSVLNTFRDSLSMTVTNGEIQLIPCGDISRPHNGLVDVLDILSSVDIVIGVEVPTNLQLVVGNVDSSGDPSFLDVGDIISLINHVVGIELISGCGE